MVISVFHRNFRLSLSLLPKILLLPAFYKKLLEFWAEISYSVTENTNIILSESLWYNACIQINNDAVFFNEFASICINKVNNLLTKMVSWSCFKIWQTLEHQPFFISSRCKSSIWVQIVDAVPSKRRTIIRNSGSSNLSREMLSKHCLYSESNLKLSVLHLSCRAIYNTLFEKNHHQTNLCPILGRKNSQFRPWRNRMEYSIFNTQFHILEHFRTR